jgi:hypothetical protein
LAALADGETALTRGARSIVLRANLAALCLHGSGRFAAALAEQHLTLYDLESGSRAELDGVSRVLGWLRDDCQYDGNMDICALD